MTIPTVLAMNCAIIYFLSGMQLVPKQIECCLHVCMLFTTPENALCPGWICSIENYKFRTFQSVPEIIFVMC